MFAICGDGRGVQAHDMVCVRRRLPLHTSNMGRLLHCCQRLAIFWVQEVVLAKGRGWGACTCQDVCRLERDQGLYRHIVDCAFDVCLVCFRWHCIHLCATKHRIYKQDRIADTVVAEWIADKLTSSSRHAIIHRNNKTNTRSHVCAGHRGWNYHVIWHARGILSLEF